MRIGKICPFRVYQNVHGPCESECQLFVPSPGKTSDEGKCSLAFLQYMPLKITEIGQVLLTISRTMPTSAK